MQISQVVADFASTLEAARSELADINAKIETLRHDRRTVERAAPHTDDIVALFMRGLADAETDFASQLAARLTGTFSGNDGAEKVARKSAEDVLFLETPQREEARRADGRRAPPSLNAAVLAYLLRDRIAAEIPQLVEKLFPASQEGMKQADREKTLASLDAEINALQQQAEALHADLGAARAAVRR